MKENYLNLLEKTTNLEALLSLYLIMEDSPLFEKIEIDGLFNKKIYDYLMKITEEQKNSLNPEVFKEKYSQVISFFPEIFESIKDDFYNELMTNEFFKGANLFYLAITPYILEDIKINNRSFNESEFILSIINIFNINDTDYTDLISPKKFKDILKDHPFYYSKITNIYMVEKLIERKIIDSTNVEDLLTKSENEKISSFVKKTNPDLINSASSNLEFGIFISKIKKNTLTKKEINELSSGIKDFENQKDKNNESFYHAIIIKNPHYLNIMAKKDPENLKKALSQKNNEGMTPVDLFINDFDFRNKSFISKELIMVMNEVGLTEKKKYTIGWDDFNKAGAKHSIFNTDAKNSEIGYLLLNMKNMDVDLDISNALKNQYTFGQLASVMIDKIFEIYTIPDLAKIFKQEDLLYMNFYSIKVINENQKEQKIKNIKSYLDLYFENGKSQTHRLFEKYDNKYKANEEPKYAFKTQNLDLIDFAKAYSEKKQIEDSMITQNVETSIAVKKRL